MRRSLLFAVLFALLPSQAFAWDYLEHAWFGDVSCHEAQLLLGQHLDTSDDDQMARYVALSLFCPSDWKQPYCKDGQKLATGSLNTLEGQPADTGEYSMTLGDYSALGDHVTRFGPVPGLERALNDGLVMRTYEWLMSPAGTAGGLLEDVGEDACETDLADFTATRSDIAKSLALVRADGGYAKIPDRLLQPGIRSPAIKGPSDPTARYSFNNPRYLDMVVRNHTHFGEQAYLSWLGFHSAALQIATRECVDVVPMTTDELEHIANFSDGWCDVDWAEFKGRSRAVKACEMLGSGVQDRIQSWIKRAEPALVDPAKAWIAKMNTAQLDKTTVALVALVLEGSGLHYLQDGIASGHMRTIRSREALSDVRYDHDHDNEQGVVARLATREGVHRFFAFGDTYLLSPSPKPGCMLDWSTMDAAKFLIPEVVTACTLEHQRGLLTATGMASLVDFALAGPAFTPGTCESIETPKGWVCHMLPMQATTSAGQSQAPTPDSLTYGTLPVPSPRYSYESLSVRAGLELQSSSPQFSLVLTFLDELGTEGHWLDSWRFGLTTTLGDGDDNQWILDTSYAFHYRLSARFMLDLGPFWYLGLRSLDDDPEFTAGVGPLVGITALPEGWIRIPLEISITYQLPLTLFTSGKGFFGDQMVEDHWLLFGIGLAFSH